MLMLMLGVVFRTQLGHIDQPAQVWTVVGVFFWAIVEQLVAEGLTGRAVSQHVFQIDQPGEMNLELGIPPVEGFTQFPAAEAEGAARRGRLCVWVCSRTHC